jgi:glutamine amidotransferase
MNKKIAIFDYGAGNLFSLKAALERDGAESVSIIHDLKNISKFDGLVLPGVGNFDPAIKSLEHDREMLINAIEQGMPVLGICLLDGEVIMLPKRKVKIPHMGWNNIEIINKKCKLLENVENSSWVYFVHSYHVSPKNKNIVAANSHYGISISALIEKHNLFGTQFHPEKSGIVGSTMIKNFLKVCAK